MHGQRRQNGGLLYLHKWMHWSEMNFKVLIWTKNKWPPTHSVRSAWNNVLKRTKPDHFFFFTFFYFPLYAFCSVRTLFRLPPSDTIFQPITRQQKIIYSLLKTSTHCRTATSFPRFLPLESESPMVDPFFFWHRGDHKLFHFRDKLMPLFTSL